MSPRFAGAGVGGRLSAFQAGVVRWRGLFARDDACVDVQCGLLALKGLKRPRRVKAGRAANEHNRLFKFAGAELRRDLIDAPLVQQQDGGDYILANSLKRQPSERPSDAAQRQSDLSWSRRYTGRRPAAWS